MSLHLYTYTYMHIVKPVTNQRGFFEDWACTTGNQENSSSSWNIFWEWSIEGWLPKCTHSSQEILITVWGGDGYLFCLFWLPIALCTCAFLWLHLIMFLQVPIAVPHQVLCFSSQKNQFQLMLLVSETHTIVLQQ